LCHPGEVALAWVISCCSPGAISQNYKVEQKINFIVRQTFLPLDKRRLIFSS
jgi:hypothetical protein